MASVFDGAWFNDRLFFPRRDDSPPPPGAEDRFVEVGAGRLHLRVHPADGATCTVLLFHGNGEVVADYDDAAVRFAQAGARLAVVDYRGYGRSEGTPTLRNTIEDAPRVAHALRDAHPLVVMGRSLGSLPVAPVYAAPPPHVVGFIWESGVGELRGLVERRGMKASRFSAEERRVFDPLPKLALGRLPLLFLHGADDEVIAPREAKRAYEAAGTERKELVMVPGRGHNDVMGSELYWRAIAAFVRKLGPPSRS
jgi:alpha-beta hydrolase superfamily lysophospholipase